MTGELIMTTRNIIAGLVTLAIATMSGVSFAKDNGEFKPEHQAFMNVQAVQKPMPMPGMHMPVAPKTIAMVQVTQGFGTQPAIRVYHKGQQDYYHTRFEKSWGKGWQTKYKGKVVVVKPGDTLTKIAMRQHTTVERLMRLNKMTPYESNHIEIGQFIRIA